MRSPNVPEGRQTVLGYLADNPHAMQDGVDYTDPATTVRDGQWLAHRAREEVWEQWIVEAPPCLRARDIHTVRAWPLDLLKRRFG
jgi:hypothetical protein